MGFPDDQSHHVSLAGGGLSLGGLLMQTFFRNPLAGPDVLGLSSGASLAVSLLLLGDQWLGGYLSGSWAVVIAASVGCSAVFLLVVTFAARVRDSASLLIIGLMVGAATASIVSVIQFQSQADSLQTFVIWTFGNVGSLNWVELAVMGIVVLVGSILALLIVKSLNAWLLGDAYLVSLGINIKRTKFIIIICTSILAGSITAFCGPIAFIGLAVPHVVKMIVPSADHRVLIPYCLIMGATILLACDVLSQLSPGNGALPLNAVTALFGAPVVVWIILKGRVIRA